MQGRRLARRWPAEPSDLASHTEGCGSAIARLDSLVQGSSGAGETTEEASDAAHEGGEGGAKRRRVDAPPGESSGAVGPPGLPTDVLRSLLPFVCGHRDDPDTLTPQNTIALCRTSEAVGSAVEADLIADIDSIIRRDGLTGVIGYTPLRQSSDCSPLVRRMRLIRLQYLMVTGGDWQGNVPVLRLAKSCGRVQQLPIELTEDDLHHVGSKAVIDGRPETIRQYALFSHRLGDNMQLTRNANGRDELGGLEMRARYAGTLQVRCTARFGTNDRVCEYDGGLYDGFRGLIIKSMAFGSSRLVSNRFHRHGSAEYHRIGVLFDQKPPLWDCRTIGYYVPSPYGDIPRRFVILCGDEEGDDFLAFIEMTKDPYGTADMYLYTTEAPQSGVGGAGSPLTVSIAHNKMGDAITLLPDVDEASNTAVAAV
ncbi:unnamed protein product [Vitrella brassicaformis CCMP3155]|uniref:Uncharacterized protein n=1 Tax=Vitrella brassicaformis (strain CCMP3155) TaxID=1169540 RepID=A0A0G4EG29_VITBC|nr:unnamed protein product [Vitrella brassicaformis CCMP3155]|eukprot:CEL94396.1 unnamed protein product [Vitrella brassicaformis CCMP3155]